MNEVQKLHRISDRKFIENEFKTNYMGDEIMEVKEKEAIKKLLADANIPANEHDIIWLYHAMDDLNLYMKMDILDGRDRNVHRINRNESGDGLYVRAVPMEDGTHRISIEYAENDFGDEGRYANTNYGNKELSYLNQLVYDIYSGCPRFEWDSDLYAHMKNAIAIINAAKDGVTYRRDIFECKPQYRVTFAPIDIINLKVDVDGKLRDKPYITGLLYKFRNDGSASIKPYSIETTLAEVSKHYENEAVMVPGELISLASLNNIFIQLIQDGSKCTDVLRLATAKLVQAKMRNSTDSSLLALNYYNELASFVDDEKRLVDAGPDVPERLLYSPLKITA